MRPGAAPAPAVRPASANDRPYLIRACLDLFEDLKAAADDPWFEGAVMAPERAAGIVGEALAVAADGKGLILLAILEGEPAGFLVGHCERPYIAEAKLEAVGHISLVRTEPPFRCRGIARALIGAAETWFRARGIAWLQLSWHPGNRLAATTWHELGFTPFRIFGRKPL